MGVFSGEGGQFVGGHGMQGETKLRTAAVNPGLRASVIRLLGCRILAEDSYILADTCLFSGMGRDNLQWRDGDPLTRLDGRLLGRRRPVRRRPWHAEGDEAAHGGVGTRQSSVARR